MKFCKHISSGEITKIFLCKECKETLCRKCVSEELSVKQCESCNQTFNKDDLNVTHCTLCKQCPLCKLVFTRKDQEEGKAFELKPASFPRRCYRCRSKFGGYLLPESVYTNMIKVRDLISHYSSYDFRGAGDNNGLVNDVHCQQSPGRSNTLSSEAQEVTETDNCADFLSRMKFDIDQMNPLRHRMKFPCRQTPWSNQLSPCPLLLKPRYTYYCKQCQNMVLTTDARVITEVSDKSTTFVRVV
ncbi:hypothetical protein WDU94_008376 [Cyamophila willieti]